jgi:hypothetical protein
VELWSGVHAASIDPTAINHLLKGWTGWIGFDRSSDGLHHERFCLVNSRWE